MPFKRPRRHSGAAAKPGLQFRSGLGGGGVPGVIVRWGLRELPQLLGELGVERPFLIASERWSKLDLPGVGGWSEVPSDRIDEIAEATGDADSLLAVGGGSAIDLAKAVSVATRLPVVSVPTTYSGSEWAPSFGIRDPQRRMQGGGAGASLAGIVYDPELTLTLPLEESVGTAMNALAHCAEALYVKGRNPEADALALEGARTINEALPQVAAFLDDRKARTRLLAGADAAGHALALAGLGLGHAMAQAIGGRYGLPHGALNAICLPAALRFNEPVAGAEIARFGDALKTGDPVARVRELARLGGFERLRDLGVPTDDLSALAEATAIRAGAKANPRPASPAEIETLLREIF
jgi:maleylacetate reductase